jgi:hypothetical protein
MRSRPHTPAEGGSFVLLCPRGCPKGGAAAGRKVECIAKPWQRGQRSDKYRRGCRSVWRPRNWARATHVGAVVRLRGPSRGRPSGQGPGTQGCHQRARSSAPLALHFLSPSTSASTPNLTMHEPGRNNVLSSVFLRSINTHTPTHTLTRTCTQIKTGTLDPAQVVSGKGRETNL